MAIDFNKEYPCPECEESLSVWVPILVTPGEDCIETGDIDYTSGAPSWSHKWFCKNCNEQRAPVELFGDSEEETDGPDTE